jgi:hypothetical protein
MGLRFIHPQQLAQRNGAAGAQIKDTGDRAHGFGCALLSSSFTRPPELEKPKKRCTPGWRRAMTIFLSHSFIISRGVIWIFALHHDKVSGRPIFAI